jgi:hypothetical protein
MGVFMKINPDEQTASLAPAMAGQNYIAMPMACRRRSCQARIRRGAKISATSIMMDNTQFC